MRYLLDTNIVSDLVRAPRPDRWAYLRRNWIRVSTHNTDELMLTRGR
jgi:predicted nucleic acid-binding protein